MKPSAIFIALSYWIGCFILLPSFSIFLNNQLNLPVYSFYLSQLVGICLIILGIGVSFYCYGLFAKIGKGTPVPNQPTTHLVTTGFYKYTRNPIYLAQYTIILGEFLWFGSTLLSVYFFLFIFFMTLNIKFFEEKELRHRFGKQYKDYIKKVPRYFLI